MVDLTNYNTLKVPARAKNLIELTDVEQLKNISGEILFLGHGANVLFTKDFDGTVVHVNLKGKGIISENDDEVIVEVAAGEDWHEFVSWSVKNNYSGLENLALIPGTVGAAIVGNIGAYGQEIKNTTTKVFTNIKDFDNSQCEFGYRESFFKHNKEYFVTAAQFKLSKKFKLNDSYIKFPENCSIQQAFDFIVATRQSKMPDWTKIGTAGSFFKNPVLTEAQVTRLKAQIPDLITFGNKVPAGKLLDVLGWKGKKIGNVSTHDKSALVIINLGGATGKEIYDYAELMRTDVRNNFDIELEYEVLII